MNRDAPEGQVVLHSSWRGRLTSLLVPALLVVWGGYGVLAVGFKAFNSIVLGLGLVLLLVGVFDYPLSSTFDAEGIARRSLGRTQRLRWDDIGSVVRPVSRGVAGQRTSRGGLAAVIGRRHFLLSDRCESVPEYDAVKEVLAHLDPGISFRAKPPDAETPPTWLYKRKREAIGPGMVDRP